MAELPAYHGRTHAPGGTDPIPASAPIKTAIVSEGQRSMQVPGVLTFGSFWANDPSFGYLEASGSPAKARYIEITEEGLYYVQGTMFWAESTLFTSNDFPYIELLMWYPGAGFEDLLINSVGPESWNDGQSPVYGEQLATAEYVHQQMIEQAWFNFDKTLYGEDSLGIGVEILSHNIVTKLVGGMLQVSRMGDLMTETTVV